VYKAMNPETVYQGHTPTCGIAAVVYIWIIDNSTGYFYTILGLWEDGHATYNSYDIKPDSHLFNMSINDKEYPYDTDKALNVADWIMISSIRDTENDIFDYDGEKNDFQFWGSTSIGTVKNLMEKLVGLEVEEHNISYLKSGVDINTTTTLQNMEQRYYNGEHEAMLINANLINSPSDDSLTADHWVVYAGGLSISTNSKGINTYSFNVFSWGKIYPIKVTEEEFKNNFYGSISGKK